MAIRDRVAAEGVQERLFLYASRLTGQYPVSSLALEDDGTWTVQLRFPYHATEQAIDRIHDFGAHESARVIVSTDVGPIRHLV